MKILSDVKPAVKLSYSASFHDFTLWAKSYIGFSKLNSLQNADYETQVLMFIQCLDSDLLSRLETKIRTTPQIPVLDIENENNLLNDNTCIKKVYDFFATLYPLNLRREKVFRMKCEDYQSVSEFAEALSKSFIDSQFAGVSSDDNATITVGELKVLKMVSAIPKCKIKEKLLDYLSKNTSISWEICLSIINQQELISNSMK